MESEQPTMPCQCNDGEMVETHLIGDGQPNVPTRTESETVTCPYCDGTGQLIDNEAQLVTDE